MTATVTLEIHCPIVPRTADRIPEASDALFVQGHWAVDRALRLALAFDAEISEDCRWTRRRRFDVGPARGQPITHLTSSLARGGWVSAARRRWPVAQLHLAEDIGDDDLSRTGAARIEIFVAPIQEDAAPKEVAACLYALRGLFHTTRVAGPNDLRCTARVALSADGEACTIVDVEACLDPSRAVAAELRRQSSLLASGARVTPTLVGYDGDKDRTHVLSDRQPEAFQDLLEPKLPPLRIDAAWIARIRDVPPSPRRSRP